jgi:biopolymer transport protein TolQ
MGQSTSILGYFLHAGWVVKAVMMMLMSVSVMSWGLIFERFRFFQKKSQDFSDFKKRFWQSTDIAKLYAELDAHLDQKSGLIAIFCSGFKEYIRAHRQGNWTLEPIQRSMQIRQAKEAILLERHLSFFASVGSISPYVGLFGTVWGIMTSFQALGHAQQATIAMVAPGISEALVATALGLFTAIPAVIAFNRFTQTSNDLLEQYELFQEELISMMEQQKYAE